MIVNYRNAGFLKELIPLHILVAQLSSQVVTGSALHVSRVKHSFTEKHL